VHYTKTHEWIREESNGEFTIGISQYAQNALGELVYVELPFIGSVKKQGESIAAVESVKAASDVYAPIDAQIVSINDELKDKPELVNSSPLSKGWLARVKVCITTISSNTTDHLLFSYVGM
jgi:glycine cleavage system H protein